MTQNGGAGIRMNGGPSQEELYQMFGSDVEDNARAIESESFTHYLEQAKGWLPERLWRTNAALATLSQIQDLWEYEVEYSKYSGHRSYWRFRNSPLACTPLEAIALHFYHKVEFSWKHEGF